MGGGAISDQHSSRIVGRGLGFEPVSVIVKGDEVPAVRLQAMIYKDNPVDDIVWNKIVNNEYRGFSYGGVTRSPKEPVVKGDVIYYTLKDIDVLEVAVCEKPSCAVAVITAYNELAKSEQASTLVAMGKLREYDGEQQVVIQCDRNVCYIDKNTEIDIKPVEVKKSRMKRINKEDEEKKEEEEEDMEEKEEEETKKMLKQLIKNQKLLEMQVRRLTKKQSMSATQNGKVKLPVEDQLDNEPAHTTVRNNAAGDSVTIAQKDIAAVRGLAKRYPGMFKMNKNVRVRKSASRPTGIAEKDVDAVRVLAKRYPSIFKMDQGVQVRKSTGELNKSKTSELRKRRLQKSRTPHYASTLKGANDVIGTSDIASVLEKGGTADSIEKFTKQLLKGQFGNQGGTQ